LISITFPENTTYCKKPTQLNYTVSDTNLQACWYSTNAGTTNTTVTCGDNITNLSPDFGSHTYLVSINDSVGKINSSYLTFYYKDCLTSGGGSGGSSGTTLVRELPPLGETIITIEEKKKKLKLPPIIDELYDILCWIGRQISENTMRGIAIFLFSGAFLIFITKLRKSKKWKKTKKEYPYT